jgi:hypothetical protein
MLSLIFFFPTAVIPGLSLAFIGAALTLIKRYGTVRYTISFQVYQEYDGLRVVLIRPVGCNSCVYEAYMCLHSNRKYIFYVAYILFHTTEDRRLMNVVSDNFIVQPLFLMGPWSQIN